jgi:PEP-CTERM motif
MKKLGLAIIGLLSAIPAFAEVVTYQYTGVINTIRRDVPGVSMGRPVAAAEFLQGTVAVGSTFHGSFSYDTSLTLNGYDFYFGYGSGKVVPASVLTIDASGASIVSGTTAPNIFVSTDNYWHRVHILPETDYSSPQATFVFYDYTKTALSSEAIPGELSLEAFWNANASLTWITADGSGYRSEGMLTSLTRVSPVPEAESFGMMIAGLGVLAAFARRRKQSAVSR